MAIILTDYYNYFRKMGFSRRKAIWKSFLAGFLGLSDSRADRMVPIGLVLEVLEVGYHPQGPSSAHPADFVRVAFDVDPGFLEIPEANRDF